MADGPLPPRIENFLAWQAGRYSEHRRAEEEALPGPFVTLSREYGCQGVPLAELLAEKLSKIDPKPTPWVFMGKEAIESVAEGHGVAAEFVDAILTARRGHIRQTVDVLVGRKPTEYQAYEALAKSLVSLVEAGRVVVLGRACAIACSAAERGVHARLTAPLKWRAEKIARERRLSVPEAESIAVRESRVREEFIHDLTGKNAADPIHYHVVFNNEKNTIEEIADLIATALQAKKLI